MRAVHATSFIHCYCYVHVHHQMRITYLSTYLYCTHCTLQQLASLLKQHGVSQDATALAQSLGIATPPTASTFTAATPSHSSVRRSSNSSSSCSTVTAKQLQRRHSTPAVPHTTSSSTASSGSGVRSGVRAPKTLDYTRLVNADSTTNIMQQQQQQLLQQQHHSVVHSPRGAPAFEPATPTVHRVASSGSSSVSADVKCASSSVHSKGRRVTPASKQQRTAAVAPYRTPVSSVSSA
jgi:hypothetical protein